jgi:transcriptional regulator with XRE-family HTH domain
MSISYLFPVYWCRIGLAKRQEVTRLVLLPGLKRLRQRAFLTQAELAKKSGVAEVTIARAEIRHSVRLSTARRLADALGVPPAELTRGDEREESERAA